MTIEFLLNEFQEKDKEKIKKIIKTIQKKPIDKNTLFLKKFTLSLLGQYKKRPEKLFKTKQIEDLTMQIKAAALRPKEKPLIKSQKIMPQPPLRLRIEDFMPLTPKPLTIVEKIPSPQLKTISMNIPKRETPPKREVPIPKFIPESPKPEKIKIPKTPKPLEDIPKPNNVPKPI